MILDVKMQVILRHQKFNYSLQLNRSCLGAKMFIPSVSGIKAMARNTPSTPSPEEIAQAEQTIMAAQQQLLADKNARAKTVESGLQKLLEEQRCSLMVKIDPVIDPGTGALLLHRSIQIIAND